MSHIVELTGFRIESLTHPISTAPAWRKGSTIIKAGPDPKNPLAWCEIGPEGLRGASFPIRQGEKYCTVLKFKGRFMQDGLEELFRITAA